MQYNNTHMIIMAGGVGSRFWPMSTPDYPKQFIDVMGVGRSLIQLTVERLKPICSVTRRRTPITVGIHSPVLSTRS